MKLSDDIMYTALLEKNSHFDGIFFAAIKTTGIFCRPTCTARKPKPENVTFFLTAQDAILHGYRPCKICKPQYFPDQAPEFIQALLNEIETSPQHKLTDNELLARHIEPNTVRRWFKKHYGMTFQAYQRTFRLNSAYNKLHEKTSPIDIAFESGFESLSGFNSSFKSLFEQSPTHVQQQPVIHVARLESPLGPLFAAATKNGLCLLKFSDRQSLDTRLRKLAAHWCAVLIQSKNTHIERTQQQLGEYFDGKRRNFDVPFDVMGSDFQQNVWKSLQHIPYGETISYRAQAELLGKPSAIRAVANANGMNPVSILIPCHRVVGADGHLTGYGGGIWRKCWLLELEKAAMQK